MSTRQAVVSDLPEDWQALVAAAQEARERAYAPYSRFPVGAAVRTASGRVFTAGNIENATYGLTVCAERVAIWQAVAAGEREFVALAVATDVAATPCGACRQVMSEFVVDMPVLIADLAGNVWISSVEELLPTAFPRVLLRPRQATVPGA